MQGQDLKQKMLFQTEKAMSHKMKEIDLKIQIEIVHQRRIKLHQKIKIKAIVWLWDFINNLAFSCLKLSILANKPNDSSTKKAEADKKENADKKKSDVKDDKAKSSKPAKDRSKSKDSTKK